MSLFPWLPDPSKVSLPWVGSPWVIMTATPLRQVASVAVLITTLWVLHRLKVRARRRRDVRRDLQEVDTNLGNDATASADLGLVQCPGCYAIVKANDLLCSKCGAELPDTFRPRTPAFGGLPA